MQVYPSSTRISVFSTKRGDVSLYTLADLPVRPQQAFTVLTKSIGQTGGTEKHVLRLKVELERDAMAVSPSSTASTAEVAALASGGYIPLTLPPGFSLANGFSDDRIRFEAVTGRKTSYVLEIAADAEAKSAAPVQFGAVVSSDLQWNGVQPSISSITVQSVQRGFLLVSTGTLGILTEGTGQFTIKPSATPAADVVVLLRPPLGFTVSGGNRVVLPAGRAEATVVTVTADSLVRSPLPMLVEAAASVHALH